MPRAIANYKFVEIFFSLCSVSWIKYAKTKIASQKKKGTSFEIARKRIWWEMGKYAKY